MLENRLSKAVMFGKLRHGTRKRGAPKLRYKDMFKQHLSNIDKFVNWRENVDDRSAWRTVVSGAASAIQQRNVKIWTEKRTCEPTDNDQCKRNDSGL